MNKIKRALLLFLTLILGVGLLGCGGEAPNSSVANVDNQETYLDDYEEDYYEGTELPDDLKSFVNDEGHVDLKTVSGYKEKERLTKLYLDYRINNVGNDIGTNTVKLYEYYNKEAECGQINITPELAQALSYNGYLQELDKYDIRYTRKPDDLTEDEVNKLANDVQLYAAGRIAKKRLEFVSNMLGGIKFAEVNIDDIKNDDYSYDKYYRYYRAEYSKDISIVSIDSGNAWKLYIVGSVDMKDMDDSSEFRKQFEKSQAKRIAEIKKVANALGIDWNAEYKNDWEFPGMITHEYKDSLVIEGLNMVSVTNNYMLEKEGLKEYDYCYTEGGRYTSAVLCIKSNSFAE